ncbi:uncharacterized protein LOC129590138 isoform X2 [Paramacrobiotus metropolitanus]|uniref:uncharacterized protein LOC129590138 isoform X2 n=1 Tax=Paramacrobiotus metropolitanus TaxID=2943436 RepID=UPI0024463B0A|nr:uncharacterized protein LOC129590138 isoform X2 [Paramacrobiotus metropolitanus]
MWKLLKQMQICLIFITVISFATGQDVVGPPQCPPDYVGDPATNRCYGFQNGAPKNDRTWAEAQKACREIGGDLAMMERDPQAALRYIRKKGIGKGINYVWVGSNDAAQRNAFTWLSGAPVNQKGILKFKDTFPTPHEKPNCIFFEFSSKAEEIYIQNAPCKKDKMSFVCQMPMFIPGQGGTYPTDKGGDDKNKPKPVVSSAGEIAAIMPETAGAAKIVAVSADKLVQARSELIAQMFGAPILSEDEMEKLLPRGLLAANISDGALNSARALLTEMTGDYMQKYRKNNVTEVAKTLTAYLLEKGRSIRCTYGVNEKQRQVECIAATTGIIDSCIKATSVDGTIVRDCGLPGMKLSGCHTTIQGVVCLCNHDLCNFAARKLFSGPLLIGSFAVAIKRYFYLIM